MAEDTLPTSSGSNVLPPQMVLEWNEEYYKRCVRAIANNWNFNVYQYNPNAIDGKELGLPMRFADRCFWWSDYYFGRQKNIDFNGLLLNADGSRRALKMFRGKDIKKFVDDQVGALQGTLKTFPEIIDAFGVGGNVVSATKSQLDLDKYLMDDTFSKNISKMLEPNGMYVQTPNGKRFADQAAEQQGSIDWVDGAKQGAVNIAKDFLYRNYWEEQFVEVAKNAYINGLGAAKVSVFNGYPLLEVFPSYEAIVPPLNTGDQHRTDSYGGRMRFMTIPEIAATYPDLGKEKLQELERIAYSGNQNNVWAPYNLTYNLGSSVMWFSINNNGVPCVAVADVQWSSYHAKEGDEYGEADRGAVLIGNKYILREGLVTNQTGDWRNPSHTHYDFMFVRPMSVMGHNMGIPETIYTYVNQIDAWQTKINEWVARAKGNMYILYAKNLPEGVNAESIITNLTENGLDVIEGVDIDAGNTQRDKLIEEIRMELPASAISLTNNIMMYRQMMADILNIPDTTRGQLKAYQPTKNIEASLVNSSKGTSTFSIPLNTFFLRLIQKGVDKFISATLDNPNIEYSLIVGDSEMQMFKATENFSLSRYGINLKLDDAADEQWKQMLQNQVFALAQNTEQSGYRWSDYITVSGMSTKSEIGNYLRFREAQIDAAKQQAAQQAEAQAQALAAQNAQSQEQQTAMREDGQNLRQAAKMEQDDEHLVTQIAHEKQMNSAQPAQ